MGLQGSLRWDQRWKSRPRLEGEPGGGRLTRVAVIKGVGVCLVVLLRLTLDQLRDAAESKRTRNHGGTK